MSSSTLFTIGLFMYLVDSCNRVVGFMVLWGLLEAKGSSLVFLWGLLKAKGSLLVFLFGVSFLSLVILEELSLMVEVASLFSLFFV